MMRSRPISSAPLALTATITMDHQRQFLSLSVLVNSGLGRWLHFYWDGHILFPPSRACHTAKGRQWKSPLGPIGRGRQVTPAVIVPAAIKGCYPSRTAAPFLRGGLKSNIGFGALLLGWHITINISDQEAGSPSANGKAEERKSGQNAECARGYQTKQRNTTINSSGNKQQ